MKRVILYGALSIGAALCGVVVGQAGAGPNPPQPSLHRVEFAWAGLSCPSGDKFVGTTNIDFPEVKGVATPRQAVEQLVGAEAPELSFDARTAKDVDPSHGRAEYVLNDPAGYPVGRYRAEKILDGWYPSGYTACSTVGSHDAPDPEPSSSTA